MAAASSFRAWLSRLDDELLVRQAWDEAQQALPLGEEQASVQPLALQAEADTQTLLLLAHNPLVMQLLVDCILPACVHVMGHSNKEWRVANALRECVMCERILALCRGELSGGRPRKRVVAVVGRAHVMPLRSLLMQSANSYGS